MANTLSWRLGSVSPKSESGNHECQHTFLSNSVIKHACGAMKSLKTAKIIRIHPLETLKTDHQEQGDVSVKLFSLSSLADVVNDVSECWCA